MDKYKITGLVMMLTVALSCSTGPRPVEYGKDLCAHCEMTVMDPRYGSELVTGKGKVFTFDSIECLLNYLKKEMKEGEEARHILVTSFRSPGELVDAKESWFIHSVNLPSPMGMYLTAFGTGDEARAARLEYGGMVFTWEELLDKFDHLDPSMFHRTHD